MSELHVDSVSKSFGTKQILSDVYLSCQKGEIVALLGRNGSGKSTLLKIIFGSLRADNKFVRVDNKMIKSLFDSRNIISYLPEHSFLPGHFKIETIINLICNKEHAEFIKANELFTKMLKKTINQLSTGERRILEVRLMVFSDSKITLLDEPFKGISPIYKEEIKHIIREQSKYKGFVVTDHDYRNILDVATKTILLYDGGTKIIKEKEELRYWGYIT
jgi:ABC-type multidrug transport system ATPase subunit